MMVTLPELCIYYSRCVCLEKMNAACWKAGAVVVRGGPGREEECMEARYGAKLGGDHCAIPWLVRHAAAVIVRYQIGKDGKTVCSLGVMKQGDASSNA